jgi:hypothetical protein
MGTGKLLPCLAMIFLGACVTKPLIKPAVAPSLPPATYHQVMILDSSKAIPNIPLSARQECCPIRHGNMPCVLDLQEGLAATPEARELRAKGWGEDAPQFHLLIYRANQRLQSAVRKVCSRRGFDLVMHRGSVVLKPGLTDVALADITQDVIEEMNW